MDVIDIEMSFSNKQRSKRYNVSTIAEDIHKKPRH
jgi:hypothetical protein